MTKITKKSSKKTFILISLAIALISILSFGATFAWFTANTKKIDGGTIKTGYLKLGAEGKVVTVSSSTPIFPGEDAYILNKGAALSVETDDTNGNFIAFKFTFSLTPDGEEAQVVTDTTTLKNDYGIDLTNVFDNTWKYDSDNQFYFYVGEGGSEFVAYKTKSTGTAEDLVLSTSGIVFNGSDNWTEGGTTSDKKLMKATITITFQAASVQASGGMDAETAKTTLAARFTALAG